MNLTDVFAWVGLIDHKVKSVCIYLKYEHLYSPRMVGEIKERKI